MKKFLSLVRKNEKTVIGVLSGTSMDAVDVVLTNIKGAGAKTKVNILDFVSYPINSDLKKFILKCSSVASSGIEDVCRLNFILGNLFAEAVKKIISKNNLSKNDIDLIGSHGQTIYHFPFNKKLFGLNTKSTLQIGEPSVIANQTGITTIGDFRVSDVSVGGDGAPLVPYLDYVLFSHKTKNRAFVNIGGISNVTYLKKSCKQNEVVAFDTGPGNVLIDSLMKRMFDKKYDKDGKVAFKGKVNESLFKYLNGSDKFYKKKPPKSTGREYYNEKYLENILSKYGQENPNDIIATVTKFTAYTIFYNLKKFDLDELIVSGGGAKNKALMKFIRNCFKGIEIKEIKENGINADNKEAVLFAVLANELVSGNKANMQSVTGSSKNVYLGKICLV